MSRTCFLEMALILLAAATVLRADPAGQSDTRPAAIVFDIYGGYFVSNQFEPDKAQSFVVFKDQKTFDEDFKARMLINDKRHIQPHADPREQFLQSRT